MVWGEVLESLMLSIPSSLTESLGCPKKLRQRSRESCWGALAALGALLGAQTRLGRAGLPSFVWALAAGSRKPLVHHMPLQGLVECIEPKLS